MVYNLSFYDKEKKSRGDKWSTNIFAENDEDAIKQVEEKRKDGRHYYCKLSKIVYKEKIIRKWEK